MDESRVTLKSNGIEEQVDRYQEVFGQKSNFIVHASVAILSFLVFWFSASCGLWLLIL